MYIFDNKEMTSKEILDCISSNRYKIEDLYLNLRNMNYSEILRLKVESLVFGRYMEADKLKQVLLFLTKINVQKLKEDISLMEDTSYLDYYDFRLLTEMRDSLKTSKGKVSSEALDVVNDVIRKRKEAKKTLIKRF